MADDGIIVEFIRHGRFVKVTAVDTLTGREVSIIGDAVLPEGSLKRLAVRRLEQMQKRDNSATSTDKEDDLLA